MQRPNAAPDLPRAIMPAALLILLSAAGAGVWGLAIIGAAALAGWLP